MDTPPPPASPVAANQSQRLRESLKGLRDSQRRMRISVDRMAAVLPKCCPQEVHEAIKADSARWAVQPTIGFTNAAGCKVREGEPVGGVMKNCSACGTTMFKKVQ